MEIWIPMYRRNSSGMSRVAIQNARVRTRSTYSRRATAKVFFQFIALSLDHAVFDAGVPDRFDVDLLELRVLLRERVDAIALEGPAEELSPVGARLEADHERAVQGRGGRHTRQAPH